MTRSQGSFLWYDLETWGRDPRRTRIAQFAAIRTDPDLNQLDEPESFYVQPALDLLPSPTACLITGLSPFDLRQRGLIEAEAIQRIAGAFAEPGTCGVGWNSLRFDDEFLRYGFYRNFIDPYRREYDLGNSRWDLMDHARLAYALRPNGIAWPKRDDGAPSFRLEHLAAANGIAHGSAHDALSDVEATLGLARLFKRAQPRLWDYHLTLRNKAAVRALLDPTRPEPVLHVSGRFPAERGCAAIILPITAHPSANNQIITCDLQDPPDTWCSLEPEDLQDRLYAPRDALPESEARVPLKAVHVNRSPALVALKHITDDELARLNIDRARCLAHAETLLQSPDLAERCRRVFVRPHESNHSDVDHALYDALPDRRDIRLHGQIRLADPADLHTFQGQFADRRGDELLFRYRARNWPETLTSAECEEWRSIREARLEFDAGLSEYSFDSFATELQAQHPAGQAQGDDPHRLQLREELARWARYLKTYPA